MEDFAEATAVIQKMQNLQCIKQIREQERESELTDKKKKQNTDVQEKNSQEKLLSLLYDHAAGRILLRPFLMPWFSTAGGWLLSTRLSALVIKPFAKANGIDLTICKKSCFSSFNDFFKRELKEGMRQIDLDPEAFISPCDARLSVYPVTEDGRFTVKHTEYTLKSLVRSEALANRFDGGLVWIYRLCVDDYHRYSYPEDAVKSENIKIPGVFHTVNPIANDHYPIYKENTREYCLLKTKAFGTLLMMEVGALLVGKIENREEGRAAVKRGEEKGNFAFGGSTIIVVSGPNQVVPLPQIADQIGTAHEIRVRMGEKVGATAK